MDPQDPPLNLPLESLNGKQIRTRLDAMVSSPAQTAHGMQAKEAMRSQKKGQKVVPTSPHKCKMESPCYALYHGPRRNKDQRRDEDPRWVSSQEDQFGTGTLNS